MFCRPINDLKYFMCVRTCALARARVLCVYVCECKCVHYKCNLSQMCTHLPIQQQCNAIPITIGLSTSKPRQTTISHVTTLPLLPNISSLHRCPREQGKAIQTITSPHPTEITTVDRTTTSFG